MDSYISQCKSTTKLIGACSVLIGALLFSPSSSAATTEVFPLQAIQTVTPSLQVAPQQVAYYYRYNYWRPHYRWHRWHRWNRWHRWHRW